MTWFVLFCFNDTATTEIYTLSLHDALPIFPAEIDKRKVEIDAEAEAERIRRKAKGSRCNSL